jgi:hypothetical protein
MKPPDSRLTRPNEREEAGDRCKKEPLQVVLERDVLLLCLNFFPFASYDRSMACEVDRGNIAGDGRSGRINEYSI